MKVVPPNLVSRIAGYSWEQITIGHSEAMTFLLKGKADNLYLKIQSNDSIENLYYEKEKMAWLRGKLSVPEVLFYGKNEANEYLLVSELKGKNASDKSYEGDLPLLMQLLGSGLKTLHNVNIENCPFNQRLEVKLKEAKKRVENGLVDEDDFDENRKGLKAKELYKNLIATQPKNEELVFTHGDFCLPNIIINRGKISGFIDLGRAGVADRYQDLALALRSISSNFGREYIPFFLKAYGLKELDETKVDFYQLLDELF